MGAPITVLAYRHWTVCDEDQGAAGFGELRWYRAKSPLEKSKGDFFCEREQKRFPKLEFSPSKHVTQTIEGCDAIGI
ncbi:hypothetical protein [Pediococcus pentosaceus]|uniref:hypothetical protein n=1 Tax=Pediococcus pentosaceus TaxID=1255 RepID=UPI0018A162AE|nr:hypothetical protein [Pediococcus pentosaceus]